MKKNLLIIAIAMMFSAVQGYAQRHGGGHSGGGNGSSHSSHSSSGSHGSSFGGSRSGSSFRSTGTHGGSSFRGSSHGSSFAGTRSAGSFRNGGYQGRQSAGFTPRTGSSTRVTASFGNNRQGSHSSSTRPAPQGTRSSVSRAPQGNRGNVAPAPRPQQGRGFRPAPPPPPRHDWRPHFGHHVHGYHFRRYCSFNDWFWYPWGHYHNRFICHRYYRDRFFDSLLGYYLYGSLTAPNRIVIGNLMLIRSGMYLQIQQGNAVSRLGLNQSQHLSYFIDNTSVEITTGGCYAIIQLYDEYGNEARYQL